MAIEYNFTLDMDRSKRDNNIAYARTGDIDSIVINADLVFGGAAYTPSGTNAFFECITPNGRSIRAAAEKTGSSVSVEVPPAAFQAAGVINVAYFRFETGASDNPTYVESTEPFAIVVREGIGDSIDAGDYIEEWRKLADQLEAAVAEVKKKAEQAETAIDEQKTEVDQLKAQAQKAIAGDVTEVEGVAQSAIAAINKEKADVADAAEGITEVGEQAINTFNTNSQQAIGKFNTDSASAISKFNTDGTSAINQFNSKGTSAVDKFNTDSKAAIDKFNTDADGKLGEVDGMITEAQGDVDAAVTQLETATDKAVSAMEDALDGTTAGSLQNAINRTLKLDVADMTNIPGNSSLSSFTNVGSYCCKTAATAATVGDCPIDDSPFNMYVFSSATSGQVMQLVVPIDMNGKPTAEWHVRFGTSSVMDKWSVIGGGADIAAGLGIDVTGDAQKTVSLDTTAFYQHHEAAEIIQGSTEVTGGGRIKELTVYGNTQQNLFPSFKSGSILGLTYTVNEDGSCTIVGTSTSEFSRIDLGFFRTLKPSTKYTLVTDGFDESETYPFIQYYKDGSVVHTQAEGKSSKTFTSPASFDYCRAFFNGLKTSGKTINKTVRVMLNEGETAEPWSKPGISSVTEASLVTAGKNIFRLKDGLTQTTTKGVTFTPLGDGGISIKGTSTGEAYFNLDFTIGVKDAENKAAPFIGMDIATKRPSDSNILFFVGVFLESGGNKDNILIYPDYVHAVVPEGATYFRSYLVVLSGKTVDAVFYPQLELGSSATAYEPPSVSETPIDLKGHQLHMLPDGTRDELRIDGTGAASIERWSRLLELDGSEYWEDYQSNGRTGLFGFDVSANYGMKYPQVPYCDTYAVHSAEGGSVTTYQDYFCGIDQNGNFWIKDPRFTTLSDFKAHLATAGVKFVAQLATSQTVDLGSIAMPDLASPDYIIYASSNIPAEIEAEVVKVDYLPAHDVYTKEEVDRKIEDAGMPSVVPVSKGGTGVTTAAAERNRLGLGNTTGALPVANGGTGATTAKAAQNALLGIMEDVGTVAEDNSDIVFRYASPNATQGAVFSRKASLVWSYIASKIRSTFGFSSSNVLPVANGGTGKTTAKAAQNALLANIDTVSTDVGDDSFFVGYYQNPNDATGALYKRVSSDIWNWIVSKIRSTFGFSSSNVLPVANGGTGLTKAPSMLVNLESASAANPLASDPRPGVSGELPLTRGGTGGTSAAAARTNLGVYSKAEVDGKVPKVVYGTGNIPSNAENGTIYIQYRS